jgi:pimeloyl-ACP methyl ester carboxylesterase
MEYKDIAADVEHYMSSVGIDSRQDVTLIGHSLGAKTAMTFACMYPHLVDRLVSLDASPVDRMAYPHLNDSSMQMIEQAISLGSLQGMSLENAIKTIKSQISDQVLQTALLFNLNADGSFQCDLDAIYEN